MWLEGHLFGYCVCNITPLVIIYWTAQCTQSKLSKRSNERKLHFYIPSSLRPLHYSCNTVVPTYVAYYFTTKKQTNKQNKIK